MTERWLTERFFCQQFLCQFEVSHDSYPAPVRVVRHDPADHAGIEIELVRQTPFDLVGIVRGHAQQQTARSLRIEHCGIGRRLRHTIRTWLVVGFSALFRAAAVFDFRFGGAIGRSECAFDACRQKLGDAGQQRYRA